MTKAGLKTVIDSLKDRCRQSIEEHKNCVCQTVSATSSCGRACGTTFTVTPDQSISLSALVTYVAKTTGRSEFRVERDLSNHFCVPNPRCLSQEQYDQAIKYMVDQVPDHFC